ncbi:hypothetical protein HDA40_005871 [Hamadaea flava]|uniref:Uncharacterized protein n=1 Tax=Hamadaea flava TaxID=1742688 RepID=A0ABV8LWL0_9ACTN|nr:hypothetical protein [Hamadaea flava]MCP2327364.1 hypothetical protein [Hamadaea flava]
MTYPSGGSQPSSRVERDRAQQGSAGYRPQHGYQPSGGYGDEPHDPYASLGELNDGAQQQDPYRQDQYQDQRTAEYPRQVFPRQATRDDPAPPAASATGFTPAVPPASGFDSTPAADQPPRKRTGLKVFLAAAIVLVLAGGVAGYVFGKPIMAEYPATVAAPDTIAGYPRSTSAELKSIGDQMDSDLRQGAGFKTTAAGVYHKETDAQQKIIMIFAGSKLILRPQAELNAAYDAIESGGLQLADRKAIPAGPLGGRAECATSVTGGVKLSICGWADHGALGMVMFFDRGSAEAAKLLLDFRQTIQHR